MFLVIAPLYAHHVGLQLPQKHTGIACSASEALNQSFNCINCGDILHNHGHRIVGDHLKQFGYLFEPEFLAFVLDAFDSSTGFFRNFMSYDRRWLNEKGSEDCHGRALWSLGFTARYAGNNLISSMAIELMERALPATEKMTSPRAWAFKIGRAHV